MVKRKDLTGHTFGNLEVVGYSHNVKKHSYWVCKCICGVHKMVSGSNLKYGKTRSCGCLIIHGMARTKFYYVWRGIKERCTNINNKSYYRYGGRGIKICASWFDFKNFKKDMYESYVFAQKNVLNCQLDRKNNNGNYEPSNCHWVSQKDNSRNRHNTKYIIVNGQKMYMSDLALISGISGDTIRARFKAKWKVTKLLKPIKVKQEK